MLLNFNLLKFSHSVGVGKVSEWELSILEYQNNLIGSQMN